MSCQLIINLLKQAQHTLPAHMKNHTVLHSYAINTGLQTPDLLTSAYCFYNDLDKVERILKDQKGK